MSLKQKVEYVPHTITHDDMIFFFLIFPIDSALIESVVSGVEVGKYFS